MSHVRFLTRYLKYLFTACTKHGVHSPFVYDFIVNVLKNKTLQPEFRIIAEQRKKLENSADQIEVSDFGASHVGTPFNICKRSVREIARKSAVPETTGRLLFNMVQYYHPENILELGTSLGISTLYLALANKNASIHTLEGCPNTAKLARKNFDALKLHHIKSYTGTFETSLNNVLQTMPAIDFAFIDGNHRYDATIHYFEACLRKVHNNSIMVFDDIHWSKGMECAWDEIKHHESVTVTIDLFRTGLVFFRKELSKQDFVIR